MFSRQRLIAGRLFGMVAAALLVAACANPRPAPVVNRTNLPLPTAEGGYPVATTPGQPLPPGMLPGQPAGQAPGGVEVSPIRGGFGPGTSAAPAPVDPNLKTAPKGLKRPYAETAAVDPGLAAAPAGGSTGSTGGAPGPGGAPGAASAARPPNAAQAPAVVATTAPPSVGVAPAPAAPPAAGGAGLLDGVAFAWPAAGTVLQNFDQTSSKGLSLGGKPGDVVRSAADGRVIFSGAGPRGYGNLIIVKHDNELLSVYAHNRSLAVKEGESVKRGQKIAELGNSGTDTPKLHFEIRQQGKPIDPLAVLPKR